MLDDDRSIIKDVITTCTEVESAAVAYLKSRISKKERAPQKISSGGHVKEQG